MLGEGYMYPFYAMLIKFDPTFFFCLLILFSPLCHRVSPVCHVLTLTNHIVSHADPTKNPLSYLERNVKISQSPILSLKSNKKLSVRSHQCL